MDFLLLPRRRLQVLTLHLTRRVRWAAMAIGLVAAEMEKRRVAAQRAAAAAAPPLLHYEMVPVNDEAGEGESLAGGGFGGPEGGEGSGFGGGGFGNDNGNGMDDNAMATAAAAAAAAAARDGRRFRGRSGRCEPPAEARLPPPVPPAATAAARNDGDDDDDDDGGHA